VGVQRRMGDIRSPLQDFVGKAFRWPPDRESIIWLSIGLALAIAVVLVAMFWKPVQAEHEEDEDEEDQPLQSAGRDEEESKEDAGPRSENAADSKDVQALAPGVGAFPHPCDGIIHAYREEVRASLNASPSMSPRCTSSCASPRSDADELLRLASSWHRKAMPQKVGRATRR